MEKLINILPNLITNEDSTWIEKEILNPDKLTQDLMRSYDSELLSFYYGFLPEYSDIIEEQFPDLSEKITAEMNLDEFMEVLKDYAIDPQTQMILKYLCGKKVEDASISSTLLYGIIRASILGADEHEKAIDELSSLFMVAIEKSAEETKISDILAGIYEIAEKDDSTIVNMPVEIKKYIATAYTLNPNVQRSDAWFDFNTLEELEMTPSMAINSNEDLLESLKDYNNYIVAMDYIKENFLNSNDPTSDDYCENEQQREYKAYMIIAKLASEVNKDNADFDKDNLVGLNLIAGILAQQDYLSEKHVWSALGNELNKLEDEAGRIADNILDKDITLDLGTDTTLDTDVDIQSLSNEKPEFKTGKVEDYIKANLRAFKELIKPNIDDCNKTFEKISAIEKGYTKWNRHSAEKIEELANKLNTVIIEDADATKKLALNLENLRKANEHNYNMIKQLEDVINSVNRKQKANLNITDDSFKKIHVAKPVQKATITEMYDVVGKDGLLKSPADAKLRIKTPKMIIADIKDRVAENSTEYPKLAELLSTFSLPKKAQAMRIVEDKLVNTDGSTNEEYREVYEAVKKSPRKDHKEEDIKARAEAIKNSPLTEEEKDELNKLI